MQTVEEVVSRMPNAKVFSVLDANHGFWQVKLANESSNLVTFNTPFGRYSYKRLPFGIASAPEVFQSIMSNMFSDIEGVEVIVDDLVVWGEDVTKHDERLCMILYVVIKTLRKFRSNCSRNENVLKLPRHGVYDILKIKSHKKVWVTELVKKI
jgi:hypothetical protein